MSPMVVVFWFGYVFEAFERSFRQPQGFGEDGSGWERHKVGVIDGSFFFFHDLS